MPLRPKQFKSKAKKQADPAVSVDEEEEITRLQERIKEEAPESGTQLSSNGELRFDSLPISSLTLAGLALANYSIATEIQAAALPHALAGRDILGAAKTGSGKTLAFVIPLIEKLYMERWAPGDGLAAVIITPTRELALQIFEVLRLVGKKHCFSAGLITGGRKDFEGEQERIAGMNILVATPGRFLQHLEQTVGFDASQVMMLVLDEADRILDMGFKAQLDSIVQYLPRSRQTMLFSATQTKSIKDLARLSLNQPEYLAVHSQDEEVTPKQLVQNYIVCKLPEKLDVLFSFIKTHLKSKMIVFLSTCSQVRYVYELFCAMQPGVPLSCLHGKIKQDKRTSIYVDFTRKKAACLLSTDIAARGLDFPNVDWVVQLDAPEDAAMYIHRVGRTARYSASGRALLMLMPTEERGIVDALTEAHVPIKKLTVNPNKRFTVAVKAAALLAAQPELKALAKKAYVGYLRSLQLLPGGRAVLDPTSTLPVAEYATGLGLAFAPEVVAIPASKLSNPEKAREENRELKNVNRGLDKLKKQIKEAKEAKKLAREAAKKAAKGDKSGDAAAPVEASKGQAKAGAEEEDDLFTVKAVHSWNPDPADDSLPVADKEGALSKGQLKKLQTLKLTRDGELKVAQQKATKIAFDEDGNAIDRTIKLVKAGGSSAGKDSKADGETAAVSAVVDTQRIAEHAQRVKAKLDQSRAEDIEREKQRVREKKLQFKLAVGNNRQQKGGAEEGDGGCAVLSNAVEDEDSDSGSDGESDGDSEDGGARGAYRRNGSDSESDSDAGLSDSEESTGFRASATKRKLPLGTAAGGAKGSKQRRMAAESDTSENSDSEDSDSEDEGRVNTMDIAKDEALVLAMLNRR